MPTTIEIDPTLLAQAMRASGLSTERATVEKSLRLLIRVHGQAQAVAALNGLGWRGDLDAIRKGIGPGGGSGQHSPHARRCRPAT